MCFIEVRCQILTSGTENLCSSYIDGTSVRKFIAETEKWLEHTENTEKRLEHTEYIEKRFEHTEKVLSAAMGTYGPGIVDVYENYTLLFSREKLSWSDSQSFCRMFNAFLIHSIDEQMNDYLKKKLKQFSGDHWIGGLRISKTGIWNTTNGEEFITWSDWADGEPTGNGECIQMWQYVRFSWDDDHCETKKKFICMKIDD
ncbi:hypothetical protein FSP39_001282 [Pinctada imbricata]|uniref:C-type lectin domain-containing protein n=1 Tax=Pinctada imbricata TaxID=66713 RepID=A0AA89C296_PINIB|nr:hypothetical protein FSP39_001282 [Pinctada imbricata]